MNVNLKKLLATACWLVILCGSHNHVEGGTQVPPTVDGILRSVVAVRVQLEPGVKNYLATRTTPYAQAARMGGLSCRGLILVPGLQRLFNCANPNGMKTESVDVSTVPTSSVASPFTIEVHVNDNLQQQQQQRQPQQQQQKQQNQQQQQKQRTTVEVIPSTQRAAWSTYGIQTISSTQSTLYPSDVVRANPLGLIIPNREQINQFQQWQRPYQPPTIPTTTTPTPIRSNVDGIVFPQSEDDRITGAVRPTQHHTTTVPSTIRASERFPWETSTSPVVFSTRQGAIEEEVTTTIQPEEEEGLGNRIDSKLLLSLVG